MDLADNPELEDLTVFFSSLDLTPMEAIRQSRQMMKQMSGRMGKKGRNPFAGLFG